MTIEKANEVCSKYGIALSSDEQLQLIIKIATLPTSEINELFNDLGIEMALGFNERKYLF